MVAELHGRRSYRSPVVYGLALRVGVGLDWELGRGLGTGDWEGERWWLRMHTLHGNWQWIEQCEVVKVWLHTMQLGCKQSNKSGYPCRCQEDCV